MCAGRGGAGLSPFPKFLFFFFFTLFREMAIATIPTQFFAHPSLSFGINPRRGGPPLR